MPRPLTLGLTGAVAAGKSEALAAFGRLGAEVISSDAIVHELLGSPEVTARLAERWGDGVVSEGKVDRTAVGEIVFAAPDELAWLESVLHPLVGERIGSWLSGLPEGTRFAVVEVPLLFEGNMAEVFDATVAITVDDDVRRRRAEARGTVLVPERESRQLSGAEKAARADHVVANDGSIEELEAALGAVLADLET